MHFLQMPFSSTKWKTQFMNYIHDIALCLLFTFIKIDVSIDNMIKTTFKNTQLASL